MASLANDGKRRPDGTKPKRGPWRVLVTVAVGGRKVRRCVRLGRRTEDQAGDALRMIQRIEAAQSTGMKDDKADTWVKGLDDALHRRLALTGLVDPRTSMRPGRLTLGGWLESYIESRRGDLKPKSLTKLEDTRRYLEEHFGKNTLLGKITPEQAGEWWAAMRAKLSLASTRTHAGNAKSMIQAAIPKIITTNPFKDLQSGSTESEYERYVTPDEIDRIIEACPDSEWKLAFGLARYGGLRFPSETHLLTVASIDFEKGRLLVKSPKTERYRGKGQRLTPIVPKLMRLLLDRQEDLPEGESRLVTLKGGWIIRHARKIAQRARVDLWEGLWQTLRSSCEKELAMTFPQYAVSKWLGHSIAVSGKHYANSVPDELFEKAAQNAAQQVPASDRTEPHEESETPANPQVTASDRTGQHLQMVSSGFEPRHSPLIAKHAESLI